MGTMVSLLFAKQRHDENQLKKSIFPSPPKKFPEYVSSPIEELHREFIKSVYIMLLNHGLFYQKRRNDAPIHFRKPQALYQLIDCELKDIGTPQSELLILIRRLLFFSPAFSHPYYMFQLLSGLDPYSVIGDFVASVIPSSMLTYYDGPVYSLMEEELSKKIRELAGYPEGVGDCLFLPGCALCIVMSLFMARYKKFPESKAKGCFHLPRLVIYVSQDLHACYQKGAIYTG